MEVTVQGHRLPLGEDLAAATDRCTQFGNTHFPAYAPDGRTFAVVVRSTEKEQGQDRIDVPWALVLVSEDGAAMTILDGIRDPSGLDWLTKDELVFAGHVGDAAGLWVLRRDGTGLTRVGDTEITSIDVAPDGPRVAAVLRGPLEAWPLSSVVWYDLGDLVSPAGAH
jgi:hypothetical protein